jgi:hypothetical protein
VLGYEFPQIETGDDANWVTAEAELAATGGASSYTARQRMTLQTTELARFRDELGALDAELSGTAEYSHLEDEIGVTIELKRGKGTLSGFIQDHVGPELRFESVEIDQSFVRQALSQFDSLVRAFPIRGDRHA